MLTQYSLAELELGPDQLQLVFSSFYVYCNLPKFEILASLAFTRIPS